MAPVSQKSGALKIVATAAPAKKALTLPRAAFHAAHPAPKKEAPPTYGSETSVQIDATTSVPLDLFNSLVLAAQGARSGGQHYLEQDCKGGAHLKGRGGDDSKTKEAQSARGKEDSGEADEASPASIWCCPLGWMWRCRAPVGKRRSLVQDVRSPTLDKGRKLKEEPFESADLPKDGALRVVAVSSF